VVDDGDDDSDSDSRKPARKKRKTDQDSKTDSDDDDESGTTPAENEEEQPPSDEEEQPPSDEEGEEGQEPPSPFVVDTENQIDRGLNTCGGDECLNAITVKDPTCLLCPNILCRDCYADKCMVCIKCTNIVTSQFNDPTKADELINSFSVETKKVYITRKDIQKA
jgi:hypothetical protein